MTSFSQNFAALAAACAIVLATMGPVVTVPASNSVVAASPLIAPELA